MERPVEKMTLVEKLASAPPAVVFVGGLAGIDWHQIFYFAGTVWIAIQATFFLAKKIRNWMARRAHLPEEPETDKAPL